MSPAALRVEVQPAMRGRLLHWALLLPMLVYVGVAISWNQQRINPITGDEPHYLLTAESLLRDGDLLVVNNHLVETPVSRALLSGVPLTDTHSLNGYSLHGLGLPLLLAPAYALAGVLGAKLCMALLIGLAPLALYRLARTVLAHEAWAVVVALIIGLGQPFVTASNQLYPDLLAGLIVFWLLVRWVTTMTPATRAQAIVEALLIALLPWLHSKLVPASILLCACTVGGWLRTPQPFPAPPTRSSGWLTSLIVGLSLAGLGLYHQIAFQSLVGPYNPADATTDLRQIGIVLLGLHLDRMQGLFVQTPLLLLGVFGLAAFVAARRRLALLIGLLYLSVLLPNATHTNWYGGFSFAGRFHWFGTLLWCFPLLYALKALRERRQVWVLRGVMLGALVLQSIMVWKLLIPSAYAYNLPLSPAANWFESNPYADFFDLTPLERARVLPSFRDLETYTLSAASWVALSLLLCLAAGGAWLRYGFRRASVFVGGVFLACASLLFWLAPPIRPLAVRPLTLTGVQMSTHTPTRLRATTVTTSDEPVGPLVPLRPGHYALELDYAPQGRGAHNLSWEWLSAHGTQTPVVLSSGAIALKYERPRHLRMLGAVPRSSDDMLVGLQLKSDAGAMVSVGQLQIWPLRDP